MNEIRRWSAGLAKALLSSAGLLLLYGVSKSLLAPAILLASSGVVFAIAARVRHIEHRGLSGALTRLTVPATLLSIVVLNVAGVIGTLTGSRSSAASAASAAFVALPFYALSHAAFITEIAARRMPLPRFIDFLTYACLPMKLLAGPIELPDLIARIQTWRPSWRTIQLLHAWPWIALGAFMKFVIASRLEPSKSLSLTDPIGSFLTAMSFELKFYFDFAGYSFLAFGFAAACGIRISQNFRHPFLARNIVLFWRSWHMSLGRYLSRYLLDPNVRNIRGKTPKLVFASTIFLASAMWHGGTVNYLLWGLFHGICYFSYVTLKHELPRRVSLSVLAMFLFFVFGRMLAIDSDTSRVMTRLASFLALPWHGEGANSDILWKSFTRSEVFAVLLAVLFLTAEIVSTHRFANPRGYHLFRKPWVAGALMVAFLLLGIDASELLYARI
jgi:alginate O-acetyltransferase complex protein AlgI